MVGLEGKISIGALDIFNGGVKNQIAKNPAGVLCRVNEGIGGMEKGSMLALKRVSGAGSVGAFVGQCYFEKGQWGHWSGSMGVLKRVNGGVGQGQWGREGQWGY